MNNQSTVEVRQGFLDFFRSKGHKIVSGSSLIPNNDPTLLFTNSGMNQFKDVFLGLEKHNYLSVATVQRCVRAGGKHNDLEKVGYTARHHTFFEMLGNFSFGDYFKHEAIQYAWELLTDKNWFNLLKERLWVTVYSSDNESYKIWEKVVGIPKERIVRIGNNKGISYSSDNFWKISDTGPCGPCTEIFYDLGEHIFGLPPGKESGGNDRYIEIWNIVFMQFNRHADGTMELLSKPSVDTGMGLERIAAVLQRVDSNYDIDLFRKLIASAAKIVGVTDLNNKSLRVIADHIRSCAFLIIDGVMPSNENRGYVLRRIIRRAIRHGNMIGAREVFFYKLIEPLIEVMEVEGKDIKSQQELVEHILKTEEEQFSRTLDRGLHLLNKELENISNNTLNGEIVFRLYDTYGFPVDLTKEICQERNVIIDERSLLAAMQEQKYRSKKLGNFNSDYNAIMHVDHSSEYLDETLLKLTSSIISLFVNGKIVDSISKGQEAIVFLNKTPFYAESGGQVGDQGELKGNNFSFSVVDSRKYGKAIGHIGKVRFGVLRTGDLIEANVDKKRRLYISLNHSATHLMHAALQKILGTHVAQKGSLVNEKLLRFDFSHFTSMNPSEIRSIENLVNEQIRRNLPIERHIMDFEETKKKGITSLPLPNGKYEKNVRVLTIGDFSRELCCGTHALRTGDIGLFHIISESSIAAGIRRIKAVTGEEALVVLQEKNNTVFNLAKMLRGNNWNIEKKVQGMLEHNRQLMKELHALKERIIVLETLNLSSKVSEIKDVKLLVREVGSIELNILRSIVNRLVRQLSPIVVVLATTTKKNEIYFVFGVSKQINNRIKEKELINMITQQIDGKKIGISDIVLATNTNTNLLPVALAIIKRWIKEKLQ